MDVQQAWLQPRLDMAEAELRGAYRWAKAALPAEDGRRLISDWALLRYWQPTKYDPSQRVVVVARWDHEAMAELWAAPMGKPGPSARKPFNRNLGHARLAHRRQTYNPNRPANVSTVGKWWWRVADACPPLGWLVVPRSKCGLEPTQGEMERLAVAWDAWMERGGPG